MPPAVDGSAPSAAPKVTDLWETRHPAVPSPEPPCLPLVVALGICLLGATFNPNADDHDRGFEAGLACASTLESTLDAVNHPTKCDVLLYADPSSAPSSDSECLDNTPRLLFANSYDLGDAFTGGLSLG